MEKNKLKGNLTCNLTHHRPKKSLHTKAQTASALTFFLLSGHSPRPDDNVYFPRLLSVPTIKKRKNFGLFFEMITAVSIFGAYLFLNELFFYVFNIISNEKNNILYSKHGSPSVQRRM
jgi:hypothetical protein